MTDHQTRLVTALLAACRAASQIVVTAESCTGGLVAAALTAVPGASNVVAGGFVTYSDAMKTRLLGVPPELIQAHGAVSEHVAAAMAAGALTHAAATLAIAITGIAGPTGGSAEKPVGLVWFATAHATGIVTRREVFQGDRHRVRTAAVTTALGMLVACLGR